MGKKKRALKRGLKTTSKSIKTTLNSFPTECPKCKENGIAIRNVNLWQCYECGYLWSRHDH